MYMYTYMIDSHKSNRSKKRPTTTTSHLFFPWPQISLCCPHWQIIFPSTLLLHNTSSTSPSIIVDLFCTCSKAISFPVQRAKTEQHLISLSDESKRSPTLTTSRLSPPIFLRQLKCLRSVPDSFPLHCSLISELYQRVNNIPETKTHDSLIPQRPLWGLWGCDGTSTDIYVSTTNKNSTERKELIQQYCNHRQEKKQLNQEPSS